MYDHDCHGLFHERLIKLVGNLCTADAFPPSGSHFSCFFYDNEFLHGNTSVLGAEMLSIAKESISSKKWSRNNKEDRDVGK